MSKKLNLGYEGCHVAQTRRLDLCEQLLRQRRERRCERKDKRSFKSEEGFDQVGDQVRPESWEEDGSERDVHRLLFVLGLEDLVEKLEGRVPILIGSNNRLALPKIVGALNSNGEEILGREELLSVFDGAFLQNVGRPGEDDARHVFEEELARESDEERASRRDRYTCHLREMFVVVSRGQSRGVEAVSGRVDEEPPQLGVEGVVRPDFGVRLADDEAWVGCLDSGERFVVYEGVPGIVRCQEANIAGIETRLRNRGTHLAPWGEPAKCWTREAAEEGKATSRGMLEMSIPSSCATRRRREDMGSENICWTNERQLS